jgi:hypothetical protein
MDQKGEKYTRNSVSGADTKAPAVAVRRTCNHGNVGRAITLNGTNNRETSEVNDTHDGAPATMAM